MALRGAGAWRSRAARAGGATSTGAPPAARSATSRRQPRAAKSRPARLSCAAVGEPSAGGKPATAVVEYLYDGECSLRQSEVGALKSLDRQRRIAFVDVAADIYVPAEHGGVTYADAMREPCARVLETGETLRSVEVYRELYTAVGLGAIWRLAELPVISVVVEKVFDVWTERRLQLTGRPPLDEILAERERRGQP